MPTSTSSDVDRARALELASELSLSPRPEVRRLAMAVPVLLDRLLQTEKAHQRALLRRGCVPSVPPGATTVRVTRFSPTDRAKVFARAVKLQVSLDPDVKRLALTIPALLDQLTRVEVALVQCHTRDLSLAAAP